MLLAITALLYARSLDNEFLFHWDDQWVVINAYTEQGFSLHNLWGVFTDFYHGQYAPLNELLYITVFQIFGYNPTAFHAASILLHACNVTLTYMFVLRLLLNINASSLNGNTNTLKREPDTRAFITAMLFAIHPVCVESVSWISASKVLVYALFYLVALNIYMGYIVKKTKKLYLLTLMFFVLSFGGKEQAVVFFFSCLLIDYVTGRKEKAVDLILEKLPFIVLAVFFGLITIMSQVSHGVNTMPQYTMPTRCLLACFSLFEYIVKGFIPLKLSYIYPFPFQPEETVPFYLYCYPLMIISLAYIVYLFRQNKLLVFAAGFFLINLLVALHIVPISRFAVIADRYAYLSLIAPCLIISGLYNATQRRTAILTFLSIYSIYLSIMTFQYQGQWKNSTTLKHHIREILKSRKDVTPPAKAVIHIDRTPKTKTNSNDNETKQK